MGSDRKSTQRSRNGSRIRWGWLGIAAIAVAVALPFIVHRTMSYYTDGDRLREDADLAEDALRSILWEPSRPLEPLLSSPQSDEYEPRVSPFGDELIFTRRRPGQNADLWSSVRRRGRWMEPRPVDGVNTDADELGAAFSADGERLYFYSNREGGLGGYDIWSSRREDDGSWGPATNLGPAVNSPWNEMSPAPDDRRRRLFFTSDRRAGAETSPPWTATIRARLNAAEYDIYVARRPNESTADGGGGNSADETDASELAFAPAEPFSALNRPGSAEGAVAVSPLDDFLYFSSNRHGGEGGFDLYRVRINREEPGPIESLGPQVNTTSDEIDPALATGGYELYFARAVDGQEDLFVSLSREVYMDRESGDPYWSIGAVLRFLSELLRLIPFDVLAFLVCLLLAALLYALVRKLLRRPSLLLRALLVAVLLHLCTALWMHRHDVERMLFDGVADEEEFDAFEVTVEGLPEESVGVAIREATASPLESEEHVALALSRERPEEADREAAEGSTPEPLAPEFTAGEVRDLPPPEFAATALADAELPDAPLRGSEPRSDIAAAAEDDAAPEIAAQSVTPEESAAPASVTRLESPSRRSVRDRTSGEGVGEEFAPLAVEVNIAARSAPEGAPRATVPRASPSVATRATAPPDVSTATAPPRRSRSEAPSPPSPIASVAPRPGPAPTASAPRLESRRRGVRRDAEDERPRALDSLAPRLERREDARQRLPRAADLPRVARRLDERSRAEAASQAASALERAPSRRDRVELAVPSSPSTVRTEPAPTLTRETLARTEEDTLPSTPKGSEVAARDEGATVASARAAESNPSSQVKLRRDRRRRASRDPHRELRSLGVRARTATAPLDRSKPAPATSREELAAKVELPKPSASVATPIVTRIRPAEPERERPQIYELRAKDRRETALARGGGSERTERAVEDGLDWLVRHQSPDGRWRLDRYTDHLPSTSLRDLQHPGWNGRGRTSSRGGRGKAAKGDAAATGLALLAFLGHGDSHLEVGPRREAVARGLAWLLRVQRPNGDLRGGGNLYVHGIAAFALCEAYAFTRDPNLRDPAQRAIDFTVASQHPGKGGWRYEPHPRSGEVDTSVFGWMLMALKSGRLGGLDVDDDCLRRGAAYLDSVRFGRAGGRYRYQPGRTRSSLAMTAQGYFSHLMLADTLLEGESRSAEAILRAERESAEFLVQNLPRAEDMEGVNFYYWYYATLAMFQTGGEPWRVWNENLTRVLLEHQVGDEHGSAHGSWDPRGYRAEIGGRVYSTALSILCLEVYYRYARLER